MTSDQIFALVLPIGLACGLIAWALEQWWLRTSATRRERRLERRRQAAARRWRARMARERRDAPEERQPAAGPGTGGPDGLHTRVVKCPACNRQITATQSREGKFSIPPHRRDGNTHGKSLCLGTGRDLFQRGIVQK